MEQLINFYYNAGKVISEELASHKFPKSVRCQLSTWVHRFIRCDISDIKTTLAKDI